MVLKLLSFLRVVCLLWVLGVARGASEPGGQGVSIDVTIPNDAFRRSYVVNLSAGERVHLAGAEGSIFDDRARALHPSAKAPKRLAL